MGLLYGRAGRFTAENGGFLPGQAGASNAIGARLGNSKWGYLDIYSNRTKHGDQSGDSSRAFRMALVVKMADGTTHAFKTTPEGDSGCFLFKLPAPPLLDLTLSIPYVQAGSTATARSYTTTCGTARLAMGGRVFQTPLSVVVWKVTIVEIQYYQAAPE
jgi:hypothetical protein